MPAPFPHVTHSLKLSQHHLLCNRVPMLDSVRIVHFDVPKSNVMHRKDYTLDSLIRNSIVKTANPNSFCMQPETTIRLLWKKVPFAVPQSQVPSTSSFNLDQLITQRPKTFLGRQKLVFAGNEIKGHPCSPPPSPLESRRWQAKSYRIILNQYFLVGR